MTWVKVCGLTRKTDVATALRAGADAIGFVLDPASARYVSTEQAAALGRGAAAIRVLVTVDMDPGELRSAVAETGADGVQPHGEHASAAAAWARRAGLLVIRPKAVAGVVDLDDVPGDQIPLLDAVRPGRHGGTGEAFDWSLVTDVGRRFVLAGGLRPDNVAEAVRIVRPWGVDASSGLESAPGIKDAGKVTAFVAEAKRP